MSLFFHPEARAEERAAIGWYGKKGPVLAGRLRDSVRATYERAEQSPKQFPVVTADCRRALTETFPYSVVFLELDGDIYIVAIAHSSRKPNYWLHRRLQFPSRTNLK